MSGNTFGSLFCVTSFGESHGPAIGCVIDGCPPNLPLSVDEIQAELDRRRPGQSDITTPRKEQDRCEILSGVFQGLPSDCASCHLARYQATTSPNHATAGFSTACQTCHKVSDLSWNQGTFNHATVFPLVGVHTSQACASCHRNGVYKGTARDCVGCHLAKYQATRDPNHAAAGFPTTCETCHKATDTSWGQGTFDLSLIHISEPTRPY